MDNVPEPAGCVKNLLPTDSQGVGQNFLAALSLGL